MLDEKDTPPVPESLHATETSHPELFANVSKGLAALDPDNVVEEKAPLESNETTEDGENEVLTDSEQPEVESSDDATEGVENAGSAEEAAETPAKGTPTLPNAYRRSLRAYEWTDAEIDAALKDNPTGFLTVASKIHGTRIAETAKWAEIGRTVRQGDSSNTDDGESEATPVRTKKAAPTQIPAGGLKLIDLKALKEKHGDDPAYDELIAPVNATIEAINRVLPQLSSAVQVVQKSQAEQMERQIDAYFAGPELKSFEKMYGTDSKTCSDEQFANRNKVLEYADALIVGSAQQGRLLTTEDAMDIAHSKVSGSFTATAIREGIKKTAKTRAKGLSLKPSKTGDAPAGANAAPATRSQLESKTRTRLATVFGGR